MIGHTVILLDGHCWLGGHGTGTCVKGTESDLDIGGRYPESINQVTASALHLFAPQPYHHSRGPTVAWSFAMPATRLCKIQV